MKESAASIFSAEDVYPEPPSLEDGGVSSCELLEPPQSALTMRLFCLNSPAIVGDSKVITLFHPPLICN
jgi:hypothetical protein